VINIAQLTKSQVTDFETTIETLFNTFFEKKIKEGGYIATWVATVSSYNSTDLTANVYLPNDLINIIPNIKNKSNVSLNSGDTIELHSRTGKLGNSYIAVKY